MAESSGSGGFGALTLGGIAGTAVVLGGVVLYQLGLFGTQEQTGQGSDSGQAETSAAANENGGFTGDGDESGQPLQNSGLNQDEAAEPVQENAETAAAAPEPETAGQESEPAQVAEAPAGTAEEAEQEQPEEAGEVEAGSTAVTAGAAEDAAAEAVQEEPVSEEPVQEAALTEPAGDAAEELAEAAPADGSGDSAKEELFVLAAPELDLVRVDKDGAAVIAGRAQAGVQVSVLLDGEVLERVEVPAGGEFVSLTTIEPSGRARVVTLLAEHEGQQSASGASFILAPVDLAGAAPQSGEALAEAGEAPTGTSQGEDVQVAALDAGSGPETESAVQEEQNAPQEPEAGSAVREDSPSETGGQLAAEVSAPEPAADPVLEEEPAPAQAQSQAVAVLRADAEGVEVVQPAVPADPELSKEIALDSISYNGTGGVELTGRAKPGSRVRVYIDNAPVAELEAAESGRWNGRLEDVDPGIYTLRLDEIEAGSGTVVSRLETPFKREAPEVLAQPSGDQAPEQPAPLIRAVTVQKGDTLWAISQERYGSGFLYVRLFEANKAAIRNPDLIYPGQVFTIPE